MPDLQAKLDQITQNTRALVQPERLAITDEAVRDLHASGAEQRILHAGAVAPGFTLPDARTGKRVCAADLLALGPVIVKFFRGRWCPYDMTELEAWQQIYPAVRERGALLVAISPQSPRQNEFTVQHHRLTFPVLSDAHAETAASFGLTWTVSPAMQRHYRSILVNVPFMNGDDSWRLPLPATYVLAVDGTVAFAEAYADHRVRPAPADVLNALEPLPSAAVLRGGL